jgi:hypothetical protein
MTVMTNIRIMDENPSQCYIGLSASQTKGKCESEIRGSGCAQASGNDARE